MGEIGFPRQEFLHDLKWWEVKSIIRGYRRRERTSCIMSRQMAFWQVKSSMADTSKITSPSDLWPLPWDNEDKSIGGKLPDKSEVSEMLAEMAAINAENADVEQQPTDENTDSKPAT